MPMHNKVLDMKMLYLSVPWSILLLFSPVVIPPLSSAVTVSVTIYEESFVSELGKTYMGDIE